MPHRLDRVGPLENHHASAFVASHHANLLELLQDPPRPLHRLPDDVLLEQRW